MNGGETRSFRTQGWLSSALIAFCATAMVAFTCPAGRAQDAPQPGAQNSNQSAAPAGAQGGAARGRGRGRGIYAELEHPVLPIGSELPAFDLPGVDGKMHSSSEYNNAKVLAIVFESNHCPVSIAYEGRIRQIYEDYKDKGVQLIAINPNNASAIRLNELGYTDSTDDMADMKIRAKLRHMDWPYLYDGETQKIAAAFGAVATPHIFIFDQDRKLRYEGRIDNSVDIRKVTENDARNAIDAILAGKPVPVATTRAFGCSTKWLDKSTGVQEEMEKIDAEPVNLTSATEDDLKNLRANKTGNTVIVEFWSLNCKDCLDAFHDYETTYRMYRLRKFNMVTVSTDNPSDQAKVLDYLKQQHASGTNLQFNSGDTKALEAAFGEKWNTKEPFVMVIGPDGNVVYQQAGKPDILVVRRNVLATIPNDGPYAGVQEYWAEALEGKY
jgi:peroxiredoxin